MWGSTFMKSTEQGLTPEKFFLVVAFWFEKDNTISDFSRSYFFVSIFVSYVIFHLAIFVSFSWMHCDLYKWFWPVKKQRIIGGKLGDDGGKGQRRGERDREEVEEEEGEEAIMATGLSRATFAVIESFVGTTKP